MRYILKITMTMIRQIGTIFMPRIAKSFRAVDHNGIPLFAIVVRLTDIDKLEKIIRHECQK